MIGVRLLPDDDERRVRVDAAAACSRWTGVARRGGTCWPTRACSVSSCRRTRRLGRTLTDLGVFSVEAGRGLCPTIVHGTIQAGLAIRHAGDRRPARRVAARDSPAESRAPQRHCGRPVDAGVVAPTLRAEASGASWRLSGCVDFVLDADTRRSRRRVGERHRHGPHPGVRRTHSTRRLRVEPLTMMGGPDRGAACVSTASPSTEAS